MFSDYFYLILFLKFYKTLNDFKIKTYCNIYPKKSCFQPGPATFTPAFSAFFALN